MRLARSPCELQASGHMHTAQTKVTSVKSLSALRLSSAENIFSWKSFHFKQSFSDIIDDFMIQQTDMFGQILAVKYVHSRKGESKSKRG